MEQEFPDLGDDRPPQPSDRPEPAAVEVEPAAALGVTPACGCGGGGAAPAAGAATGGGRATPVSPSHVYAIGQVDFHIPSLEIEKEIAQSVGRGEKVNLTDRQAVHAVLAQPEYRYLARSLCYVLSVQGIETYILRPADPFDLALLVEAVRPEPQPGDLDVVIGTRGPLAPPTLCNGLTLPVVDFEQIFSFDREEFVRAMPRPEQLPADRFEPAAAELMSRLMQLGDNAGDTDEHRAANYLLARYPRIYHKTVELFAAGCALSAVDFRESPLGGARTIVDVVFSYTDRQTDVTEKQMVSVDVQGRHPFLVKKLSPYYDH
ncbi:hypothetical protein GCM10009760_35240 [Kitasatospora kazusensis]|uniref:PatG domain-containing protein n=1 Tax=Kitasatospora kazusensis TaxID=407974 RepID=A0ABN2ZQM1_9ACTN